LIASESPGRFNLSIIQTSSIGGCRYGRARYSGAVTSTGGYANGIRVVVETMLQSPNFLYRPEVGAVGAAPARQATRVARAALA